MVPCMDLNVDPDGFGSSAIFSASNLEFRSVNSFGSLPSPFRPADDDCGRGVESRSRGLEKLKESFLNIEISVCSKSISGLDIVQLGIPSSIYSFLQQLILFFSNCNNSSISFCSNDLWCTCSSRFNLRKQSNLWRWIS